MPQSFQYTLFVINLGFFWDPRMTHKKELTLKWMWDMGISASGEIQEFTSNQETASLSHAKAVLICTKAW